MTPEEHTSEAATTCGHGAEVMDVCHDCIAAIRAAVAERTEACAKIAEDQAADDCSRMEGQGEPEFSQLGFSARTAKQIANAIRAMGEPK